MEKELPEKNYDKNNVYALTLKGEEIHVSEAESGANGYLCLGCTNELVAVKSLLPNRIDYFRHLAIDVDIERKCVYSDETHRHKLAKRILLQNKFIKVPPIYKYPPKGQEGLANIIKESEIIEAHDVKPEITFYEDLDGKIHWGSNENVDERFLTIKPDIAFFDITGNPILLIELVATHKPNAEKLAKLKRLGINTIQVRLPKDSPEAIENSFKTIERTKWLYNHDEQHTDYVPVSNGDAEGIPTIDEEQRKLLEESFKCRQAQINNLIRTIARCLESKRYGDISKSLRAELSRVASNTEEHQSRLDELRAEYKDRAIKGLESQTIEFDKQLERFELEERNFSDYYQDVEGRYTSKRISLEGEEKKVDSELYGAYKIAGGDGESIEGRRAEIIRLTVELRRTTEKEMEEIGRIENEESGLSEEFRQLSESITSRFDKHTKREHKEAERIDAEQIKIPKEFGKLEEELRRTIETTEADLPREFGTKEEYFEKEFEGLREQSNQIVMSRITKGNTEMHTRVRGLLEARELLNDFEKTYSDSKRNRTAWEHFKNESYENWVE